MRYEIRAMTVGAVFDRAYRVYLENFWIFLSICLVFAVPAAILFQLVGYAMRGSSPVDQEVAATFISFPVSLLTGVVVQGALVQAVSDVYLGAPATLGRSFRLAFSRFFPLALGVLLYSVAVGIGTVCGFGVLGFYLTGGFFAVIPAVVLERKGPVEALQRSWHLSEKGRWRAFATIFFGQMVASFFAGTLAGVLQVIQVPPLVLQSFAQIAQALVLPYTATVVILLYYDVRVRREAFDLQMLAREAGRAPAPSPSPAP
jgi:hypothetical protein